MSDCIRVLEINFDSSEYGGVSVFLINILRAINHDKFQLDFLTPDKTSFNQWRDEIESAGGNIYEFHINVDSRKGKMQFGRQLRSFLENHMYDIVHINCGVVSFDCISASAAKIQGANVVVHSHNAGGRSWWKNLPVFFLKRRMQRKADVLCACSTEAARNVFTPHKVKAGEVIIINNGIDLQKFQFDQLVRNKKRQEFEINDNFVVGHVGRFEDQKNHEFLVDIFAEILKKDPKAVLLLIGEGKLEEHIREKVSNLNIVNNVLFLGQRNDVADLYQAMDVFLFPSLFEGLPISIVEAQTSGLPCFISDTISTEVDLTPLVHRLSLHQGTREWAHEVLSSTTDSKIRRSYMQELMDAGYGIQATAFQISKIYEYLCTL